MSLFPLDQPDSPAQGASGPNTLQQEFSSFDQAKYAADLAQQRREQAGGGLAVAASQFASSSSEDDSSHEQLERPDGDLRSASHSESPEHDIRSRKRRRVHHKQGRHKHKKKSRRTDAEKILEKERKAATLGIHGVTRPGYATLRDAPSTGIDAAQEDRKGDLQNSALYSLHQPPATRAWDPLQLQGPRATYGVVKDSAGRGIGAEMDDDKQRSRGGRLKARDARPEGVRIRYFTKFRQGLEQDRGLPRWRRKLQQQRMLQAAGDTATMALPSPAYVPLEPDDASENQAESIGAEMQRRQRELRAVLKQNPHDLQAWQNLIALLENPIALSLSEDAQLYRHNVLEHALRYFPESEPLLVQWVPAFCQTLLPYDTMDRFLPLKARHKRAPHHYQEDSLTLWGAVLEEHPGCTELWRTYLDWLLHDYTRLDPDTRKHVDEADATVLSLVQQAYGEAVQAQAAQAVKMVRQGTGSADVQRLEESIVGLLGDACRLYLSSGHTEKTVGIIQALLEYHFFAPPVAGPAAVKLRLFKAFWNQSNALIGEEGAVGWSRWLSHGPAPAAEDDPEPDGHAIDTPTQSQETVGQKGAWTEFVLEKTGAPAEGDTAPLEEDDTPLLDREFIPLPDGPADHGEEEDNWQDADIDADVDALLNEFGPTADPVAAGAEAILEQHAQHGVLYDGQGWSEEVAWTWAELEQSEDDQAAAPARAPDQATAAEPADSASAARSLAWSDVQLLLTPLSSAGAKQQLAHTLLDVLDAPLGQWACSSTPAAMRTTNARPGLRADTAAALAACVHGQKADEPHAVPWLCIGSSMPFDPGTEDIKSHLDEAVYQSWFQVSGVRRALLARMLRQLVDGPLADDAHVCAAFMAVEEQATASELSAGERPSLGLQDLAEAARQQGVARARAAAKSVLASRRESLVLWSTYAQFEARVGNRKAARKVWSTVLTSLADRPATMGRHGAELALPFAEMEAAGKGSDAAARALHVLTWLGAGGQYAAYQGRPDVAASAFADRILQAKQGFDIMLSAHMRTGLSPAGAAVIAADAVFELMAAAVKQEDSGTAAASTILENICRKVRQQSPEHEGLCLRWCRLVVRAAADRLPGFNPGRVRAALMHSLEMYSGNAELWSMLAKAEAEAHMSSSLKQILAQTCREQPECLVALLAHACVLSTLPASDVHVGSLLSTATRSETGPLRRCPVLHRAFAWFGACREPQATAALRLNRGLIECPWSKVLLLERFGTAIAQVSNYDDLLDKARQWGVFVQTPASWAKQVAEHMPRHTHVTASIASLLAVTKHQ